MSCSYRVIDRLRLPTLLLGSRSETWPIFPCRGRYDGEIGLIPRENRMDRLASMETFIRR